MCRACTSLSSGGAARPVPVVVGHVGEGEVQGVHVCAGEGVGEGQGGHGGQHRGRRAAQVGVHAGDVVGQGRGGVEEPPEVLQRDGVYPVHHARHEGVRDPGVLRHGDPAVLIRQEAGPEEGEEEDEDHGLIVKSDCVWRIW